MVKAGRQGRRQKEEPSALSSRSGRPAAAALDGPAPRKRKAEAAAVPESPTSASAARGRGRHSRRKAEAAPGARDGGGDSGAAEAPTADAGPAGELEAAILAILGRRKRASTICLTCTVIRSLPCTWTLARVERSEGGRPVWMEASHGGDAAGRKGACLARTTADRAEGRGPRSITAHQGADPPASASINAVMPSLQLLDFIVIEYLRHLKLDYE
eukprot:SM000133S26822  [mRNA]  locus=s133:258638:259726:- [translate_table: standard]